MKTKQNDVSQTPPLDKKLIRRKNSVVIVRLPIPKK